VEIGNNIVLIKRIYNLEHFLSHYLFFIFVFKRILSTSSTLLTLFLFLFVFTE